MEAGKPAEDAVKLFVGQVPRDWTVEDLRPVLMEAGHVYEVTIVRDKETKESRGCAFVLYMTRDDTDNAIKLFHGQRTLPGSKGTMQVKYADGQQVKLENKLFVGMLPKTVTPEELKAVFEPFGTVVDLNILRGPAHATKGSAFVKFESYSQAQNAINGLNMKHRLEGSGNAIVVKWADSDKEKELRKAQKQATAAAKANQGQPGGGVLGQHYGGSPGGYGMPHPGGPLFSPPPMPPLQYGLDLSGQQAPSQPFYSPQAMDIYAQHAAFSLPYGSPQMPSALPMAAPGLTSPEVVTFQGVPNSSASAVAAAIREKLVKKEGPPGSNLFVYNIPGEWRDEDLTTAFQEFGNVLSSKVFFDKVTGTSKNFGFVSFDAQEAAEAAIAIMDGFMVAGRKLKVSVKRGNAAGLPPGDAALGMSPMPLPGTPY